MGERAVKSGHDGSGHRRFMRALLDDLRALEALIGDNLLENEVRRIGAEQELFIVDRHWRPALSAMQLLEELEDPHFTTELGLFNLEINLDPAVFEGRCLGAMEEQAQRLLGHARAVAERHGQDVLLTGILPTLRKSDLGIESMTPMPRYRALNDAMSALRGGAYEFHIKGLDELLLKHDSVMLEACNASFQVHFQVSGEEFANLYNIAQIVAGPVLAAAVNSPLLFGRQLWRETRIALFQQAVDTRSSLHYLRERRPRVTFGDQWVRHSVLELFQEDISRFRPLVTADVSESPFAALGRGEAPELRALRVHNSTVYRWNRACYGVTEGKPHLRIENRILPAGPTVADEMANATLWFGLITALSYKYEDITRLMHFEDAKTNFHAAGRHGLDAQLVWFNGETLPAARLLCDRLIPSAREALVRRGIDAGDIERYLGIVERRVAAHVTGASWAIQSLSAMRGKAPLGEQLNALTAAMLARQREGSPVAEWEPAQLAESGGWKHNFIRVEQYMSTDLFTVSEQESLDLVACLMEWEHIRHVPVEDHRHRLVGLISYRCLLRRMARGDFGDQGKQVAASEVMLRDPVTISPEASTLEAIDLMRRHRIGCLPVVKDERLVGVVTERDFMNVAAEMLAEQIES
jgi:CBS domain-containing protein